MTDDETHRASLCDDLDNLRSDELLAIRQLAAAPGRATSSTLGLGPGDQLTAGLKLERLLGTGAMGAVFLAWDSRLERHVAVKIHLEASAAELARLEQEARALAKVSHPNVLTVHEVGMATSRLFVSTEYVEGQTLAEWTENTEHPWPIVVKAYIDAARGLAAAHDAGLVHRDFKPANVLLGNDGRIRVADFGLARKTTTIEGPAESLDPDVISGNSVTRTDTIAGTPAYMAPEQFRGEVDTASDQFSLCVALVEALIGRRPYRERLAYAALEEDLVLRDGARKVPRRYHGLLRRGLALDPAKRHASMHELIVGLEAGLPESRAPLRKIVWAASGAGLLGLTAALIPGQNEPAPEPERCADGPALMDEIWNEARDESLAVTFTQALPVLGRDAWRPLAARVDAFGDAWVREREASCRATVQTAVQSETSLERSIACFAHARAELDATLRALERTTSDGALTAWRALPSPTMLSRCRDSATLSRWDMSTQPALDVVADLAYARSLRAIGQWDLADEALATAATSSNRDADLIDLHRTLHDGKAAYKKGDATKAREKLEDALFAARRQGNGDIEFRAAINLGTMTLLGDRERGEAKVWLKIAENVIDPPNERAAVIRLRAVMLETEGKPQAAIDLVTAALEQTPDEDLKSRSTLYDALNTAYDANGQPEEALAAIDEGLAISRKLSGEVATNFFLSNRGLVLAQLGRHDEAVQSHKDAIESFSAVRDPALVQSNGLVLNLALALLRAGQSEQAIEMLDGVLNATVERFGEDHLDVALVLEVQAEAFETHRRYEEAVANLRRAFEISRNTQGTEHPDSARFLFTAGLIEAKLGRLQDAVETARIAAVTYQNIGYADHPHGRWAAVELAKLYTRIDRDDEATIWAKRARLPPDSRTPPDTHHLQALLTLSRLARKIDPRHARTLATDAQTTAVRLGDKDLIEEADALLKELSD